MVKFVETDTSGLPLKRKQVAQACEKCRRRKKRCVHAAPDQNGTPSILGSPDRSPAAVGGPQSSIGHRSSQTRVSPPNPATEGAQPASPVAQHGEKRGEANPPAFYGDLNPEAILMEATSLCSHRDVSAPGGLGIWQTPIAARPSTQGSSVPSVQSSSRRAVQDMVKSYLWNHCLPCRPPPNDYAVLRRIYFEKMNPIFPILEDPDVSSVLNEPTDILVQQVISLAAAADPEAVQHLRVSPNGNLMSRQEFCACMSNSVLTTLDAGIVTDRVWLVRLSAALSLYSQPTNSEEADIPALLNSRAVHQVHTLGLHMAVGEAHPKKVMIQTLFCCVWALDRITGAFYGRARLLHRQDVGWDFDDCIRAQAPPFRLLLTTINILDEIIDMYCPQTRLNPSTIIELPIFEQMILDAEASRITSSCLGKLGVCRGLIVNTC